MKTIKEKYSFKELLLVALLILVSGSPNLNIPIVFGGLGILALLYSLLSGNIRNRGNLWKYILFICVIFFGQIIVLDFISVLGSINVIAKIIFGATVMWVVKERFRGLYLNVMYFFAAVSLIFFFLEMFGIKVPDLFPVAPNRNSILIFNSLNISKLRNCGPFWEPGAFACYIILVPLLYIDNLRDFVSNNKKKVIVITLALITTISTTGYICLFAIIIYYYIKESKNKVLTYFVYLPISLFAIYYAYNNLEFMSSKIEEQTERTIDKEGEFTNTRLGSLLFDVYYIEKHPIVGNGLHEKTRYADHPMLWGENLGHGNAFSNYTAQMGIVAMLVYFILVYRAFNKKIIVPIIIILLFQGEQLMNYPLFPALPFIILPFNRNSHKQIAYNRYEKCCNNNNRI